MATQRAQQPFAAEWRQAGDFVNEVDHRVGGHKARLFASLFAMTSKDTAALQHILLNVIRTEEATLGDLDEYGQRYVIDFLLTWHERQAIVRSAWIIRPDEDFPRLVTCYPL